MAGPKRPDVQLTVSNESSRSVALVLEPLGEVYSLGPGAKQAVWYRGDPQPRLTIEYGEDEIKLWEEGPGELQV
jgi:hypothetical protein